MSRKRSPDGLTSDSQPQTKFPKSSQKTLSPFHNSNILQNFVPEPQNFSCPIRGRQLQWLLSQISSFVNPFLRIQEEKTHFKNRKARKKIGLCKGLVKDHFWIGLSEVGKALERMNIGGESEEKMIVLSKDSGESEKFTVLLGKNGGESKKSAIVLGKNSGGLGKSTIVSGENTGESEKNGTETEQTLNNAVKNLVGGSQNNFYTEILLNPENIQSLSSKSQLVDHGKALEKSEENVNVGEILKDISQKETFSLMELERQVESGGKNESFLKFTFEKDNKKIAGIDTVEKREGEEQEKEERERKEQERVEIGRQEKEGEEGERKEKEGEVPAREEQEREAPEQEEQVKEGPGREGQEREDQEREEQEREAPEREEQVKEGPEREGQVREEQGREDQEREEKEREEQDRVEQKLEERKKEEQERERQHRQEKEKGSKVLLVIYAADVYPRYLVSHLNFLANLKKVPIISISGEDGSGSVRLGKALGLRTVTAVGFKGNLENLGGESLENCFLLKNLLSFVERGGVLPK